MTINTHAEESGTRKKGRTKRRKIPYRAKWKG